MNAALLSRRIPRWTRISLSERVHFKTSTHVPRRAISAIAAAENATQNSIKFLPASDAFEDPWPHTDDHACIVKEDLASRSRSILRQLLRAAHQLPDSATRTYYHAYILYQYRKTKSLDEEVLRETSHRLWDIRNATVSRTPAHPLHLYRHLLRAVTYLPDDVPKQYFRAQVQKLFRSHIHGKPAHAQRYVDDVEKFRRDMKRAQKLLVRIKMACEGETSSLQKVILLAYGRIGPRKHKLLAKIKGTGPWPPVLEGLPGCSDMITEALRPLAPLEPSLLAQIPRFTSDLEALLRSQQRNIKKFNHLLPNPLKRVVVDIPLTNSWGRRMPSKRIKNLVHKTYAYFLSKALPPLPQDEWEQLGALARGDIESRIPERRAPVDRERINDGWQALERTLHVAPQRDVRRERDRHQITVRSMQRLYHLVADFCPSLTLVKPVDETMDFSRRQQCYNIEWGCGQKDIGQLTAPFIESREDYDIVSSLSTVGDTVVSTKHKKVKRRRRPS